MIVLYILGYGQDLMWVRKESNFGPLSYQESVLPLNYAPQSYECDFNINPGGFK